MENKKKKKFKLFDLNKDGKGVEKENRKPTLGFFFKSFIRKFPNLLRLNLLMIFQVLPIAVIAAIYFLGTKSPSAANVLFAPLYGLSRSVATPDTAPIFDMSSIQMGLPVFSPAITYTMIALFVLLAVTWGWQNVGASYVLRGLVSGEPVFIFSDFFHSIKRNFKQGFLLGLLDFAVSAVLIIDFLFFYQRTGGSFGLDFMYIAIFALAILYFIMRFYLYLLLVTFDLKNFKILKNALIFSILGIKRNILAFIGIAVLLAIHIALIVLLVPMGISLPLVIPLIYIMSVTAFMAAYAAYPVIDKYMIEPYVKNEDEDFVYLKSEDDGDTEEHRDETV